MMTRRLFLLLALSMFLGSATAQPACDDFEGVFASILEFCVIPEFPTEQTEIFARFVILTSSADPLRDLDFEVDGNTIRLAGRIPQVVGSFVESEELVSLGRLPQGDYALEFYADIELNLIAGGGIIPPDAVRTFTVAPAPRDVPTLQWWGMLLLVVGMVIVAVRAMRRADNARRQ